MGDEHPDGYSSTRNFHICNAHVRTMIGCRPDGWSRIGNFLLWCTRVRTKAVKRPDGHIWIAILALRRCASGRDTTSSGRLIDLPFLRTWKEIRNWSSTGRCPDVLLKRPDGCKLAQKTSRYSIGSGRNEHFVRTEDAGLSSIRTGWHVVWTDVTVDRWASGRLTGNLNSSDLQTLNSGILVYNIFTLKCFCPNTEWGQNTNINLSPWGQVWFYLTFWD
jgi:hypothetical protein